MDGIYFNLCYTNLHLICLVDLFAQGRDAAHLYQDFQLSLEKKKTLSRQHWFLPQDLE
jgi:hypothetical protein